MGESLAGISAPHTAGQARDELFLRGAADLESDISAKICIICFEWRSGGCCICRRLALQADISCDVHLNIKEKCKTTDVFLFLQ